MKNRFFKFTGIKIINYHLLKFLFFPIFNIKNRFVRVNKLFELISLKKPFNILQILYGNCIYFVYFL